MCITVPVMDAKWCALITTDVVFDGNERIIPLDIDNDGTPDYLNSDSIAGLAGDINGNGGLDISDWLLMQQAVAGQKTLNASQLQQADVYPPPGDGLINVSDLLVLKGLVLPPKD
jgi:hypothetical protein